MKTELAQAIRSAAEQAGFDHVEFRNHQTGLGKFTSGIFCSDRDELDGLIVDAQAVAMDTGKFEMAKEFGNLLRGRELRQSTEIDGVIFY